MNDDLFQTDMSWLAVDTQAQGQTQPLTMTFAHTQRTRNKIRKSVQQLLTDPGYRARQLQANKDIAKRDRVSQSACWTWADPVRRAQRVAVVRTSRSEVLMTPSGVTTTMDFRHALMLDERLQDMRHVRAWNHSRVILEKLLKNQPNSYYIIKAKK